MNKNIYSFVNEVLEGASGFDSSDKGCIRGIIRKAIKFYRLKSYEEAEQTDTSIIYILHIDSMIEENVLTKVVELVVSPGTDRGIEFVYDGKVYRHY